MVATVDEQAVDRMTLREAASLARLTTKALRRWVQRGVIRGWKVGGRVEVARADVIRFAAGTPIGPAPVQG